MCAPLQTVILRSLEKNSLSGYQLIKQINTATGWKPSTGSVYPLLDAMRKKGILTVRQDGRRRVYTITTEGKAALLATKQDYDRIFDRMIDELHVVSATTDMIPEAGAILELLKSVRSGKNPFRPYEPELSDLKRHLLVAMSRQTDTPKVRAILKEAATKLKRIDQ